MNLLVALVGAALGLAAVVAALVMGERGILPWWAVLAVVAVVIWALVRGGAAAIRKPRCHICGTRGRHRCNLIAGVQDFPRFQRGILRDPDRRAGEPLARPTAPGSKQADIVWECPHTHNRSSTPLGRRREVAPAAICARSELDRLQRGRADWAYPFRPRPVGHLRFEPGVRLSLPRAEWERLVQETNGCCFYCGTQADQLEAEHVIPVVRGGSSMTWNFVPACGKCNRLKGARTGWEFVPQPTTEQRQRFLEIDRLTQRRRVAWLQRRRLLREAQQRRRAGAAKRSRIARQKSDEKSEERWQREFGWPPRKKDDTTPG